MYFNINIISVNLENMQNLTCVSGYWKVKNKHEESFDKWFPSTLKVNCPYVFFTDKETMPIIQKHRNGLPTYYIECNISDFETYKFKHMMLTDTIHCPSVELNLIWNEKIFLIKKAAEINPFTSDFFCWIDAGFCKFRKQLPPNTPFPDPEKLKYLPKDKFIYCSSLPYNEQLINVNNHYHHVSGTFILHKDIIHEFCKIYMNYLEKLLIHKNIWTDQVILTHIYKDNKHLFHKLCDGYGTIIKYLY